MYQSLKKTQNCLEKTYYEYLCLKFINNLWDNWVIIVTEDELILHSVYLLCFHSLLLFLVFVHVLVHVIVRKSLWCFQHEVKCSSQLWPKCLNSNFDGAHFQEQSQFTCIDLEKKRPGREYFQSPYSFYREEIQFIS